MSSKNFIIDLVVYPFDVMVSVGENDEVLFAKLKKFHVEEEEIEWSKYEDNIGRARYCLFSTGQSLIRIKSKPRTSEEWGRLQHEIFHCTVSLLWKIGLKLKIKSSDEAYAYLIGYLTEKIYDKL